MIIKTRLSSKLSILNFSGGTSPPGPPSDRRLVLEKKNNTQINNAKILDIAMPMF